MEQADPSNGSGRFARYARGVFLGLALLVVGSAVYFLGASPVESPHSWEYSQDFDESPDRVNTVPYQNHPFQGYEALPPGHPDRHPLPGRRVPSNGATESSYQPVRMVTRALPYSQDSPSPAVQMQYASTQTAITTEQQNFINNVLMPAAIAFFAVAVQPLVSIN